MADDRAAPRRVTRGGSGGRVVLVHGFTQTLAAWGAGSERLPGSWGVVRVGLPGRGRPGGAVWGGGVGGGGGAVGGSWLGGRLCLRLALDRPDLVRALVLVGASPGIADPGGRGGGGRGRRAGGSRALS